MPEPLRWEKNSYGQYEGSQHFNVLQWKTYCVRPLSLFLQFLNTQNTFYYLAILLKTVKSRS